MKTLDEIKVEIETILYNGITLQDSVVAESILSIPISKGEVCEKCGGSKMGIYYFNRKAPCDTCQGTGTADITVTDAIKEKLK